MVFRSLFEILRIFYQQESACPLVNREGIKRAE